MSSGVVSPGEVRQGQKLVRPEEWWGTARSCSARHGSVMNGDARWGQVSCSRELSWFSGALERLRAGIGLVWIGQSGSAKARCG